MKNRDDSPAPDGCQRRLVVPWRDVRWDDSGVAIVGAQEQVDEVRNALSSKDPDTIRRAVLDWGGDWNEHVIV